MVLGLHDLGWSWRFLQLKWNFFNHLVIVLWSTTLSLFCTKNVFGSFCSVMAQFEFIKHEYPNWIMLHICLCCFQIFQRDWSSTQHVSAPTITILPNMMATFHGLKHFDHVIYMPQTSTYENVAKLLTHPRIYQDIF